MQRWPLTQGQDHVAAAVRLVTGVIGSYLLVSTIGVAAVTLSPTRVDTTAWTLALSFPSYACLLLWCYAERRLSHVVVGIWGSVMVAAIPIVAIRL